MSGDIDDKPQPLIEHLMELRTRLIWSLVAFFGAFILCFAFAKHLFNLLKGHFDKIPNAGINVLTEILHTRDPDRYPVMNRNSVAGLGLANITDYPRSLTKKTVDGDCYARFTVDAETLRDRLGLASLSELDGLFNFAYWQPADPEEES